MLRRVTLALILLASAGLPARAQERLPRLSARPTAWGSLSIGLFQLQDVFDPESNSEWDFGNIVQFRGTLEREFQRAASLGVAASIARAPLSYRGDECATFCDADVTLWQVLALLRLGAGGSTTGFHSAFEFGAGLTGFSGFRRRGGGEIGPGSVIDPTLSVGYGLGYGFSPNTQFMFLQEVGLMLHRRGDRPAGDESNVPRTYSTRIGLRVGLGGWR